MRLEFSFFHRVIVMPTFLMDDFGTELQVVAPGAGDHELAFRTEISVDAFCHVLSYGLNEI